MRLRFGAVCAAAFALCASGLAPAKADDAQPWGDGSFDPVGPYVGVLGGGSFLNDISPSGAGTDVKSQWQNGYVALGVAGWNFGNGFRGELEGGYRHSDLRGVRGSTSATGDLGMPTVMVNGLYDIDPNRFGFASPVVPHVGVGVGWTEPNFQHAGPYNGSFLTHSDELFAYQGIAGLDYRVMPQVKLSLDYRYLGTERGSFNADPGLPGATKAAASIQDQAVTLGIRYEFGSPPPAPMPAPPPPPAPLPAPIPQPEPQRQFQVFFDFNKSDITAAAARVIKSAADAAQAGHFVHVVVTGHTDTVGSAQYNQGLSERRAASVKRELVTDGLPDSEITTLGVGKTGLLVPTADGVREAQNRRATIELGPNAGS